MTSYHSVLGIDPGKTTGMGLVAYDPEDPNGYSVHWLGEIPTRIEVYGIALASDAHLVAIERFISGPRAAMGKDRVAADTARSIVSDVLALERNVIVRNAADVKRWATDRRLASAGLLAPTAEYSNHGRDAVRHALYSLVSGFHCPDPMGRTFRRLHPNRVSA